MEFGRRPSLLQKMLPEEAEKLKDTRDDLLEGLVMPLLQEQDRMRDRQVKIFDEDDEPLEGDPGKEEGTEEIKEEPKEEEEEGKVQDYESRRALVEEDDTPKEDFFDVKEDEEEEQFGVIEGMVEVTEEEEEEGAFQIQSRRLSVYAQQFFTAPEEQKKETSEIIDEPGLEEEAEEDEEMTEDAVNVSSSAGIMHPSYSTHTAIEQSSSVRIHSSKSRTASKMIDLAQLEGSTQHQIPKEQVQDKRLSALNEAIYYDIAPRKDSDSDIMDFFDFDTQVQFFLPDDLDKQVEEEEIVSVIEEEPEPLDRAPYYEKYDELLDKIATKKIKNNLLQKKVVMYLKRRKVEHFLKESSFNLDQLFKYQNKLDAYQEILEFEEIQRKTVTVELDLLKKKSSQQSVKLEKLFKAMQTREGSVGYGLIYIKTGAIIPDKLVERFLKRQKVQMGQVATMRLKYIKLKGMVQEKTDAIERTDKLENNLRLADYEQLKVDNRNYADKIEEREEELCRLRSKCQNTIQVLAHMREKMTALHEDMYHYHDEVCDNYDIFEHRRARLVEMKHLRDKVRKYIADIKRESGLLIHPDLLKDMENSMKVIVKVQEELDDCKAEVKLKSTQIRNLRRNIERLTEILARKRRLKDKQNWANITTTSIIMGKPVKSNKSFKEVPTIYTRRPTLHMPIIKQEVFNNLIKIKTQPKTLNRSRR